MVYTRLILLFYLVLSVLLLSRHLQLSIPLKLQCNYHLHHLSLHSLQDISVEKLERLLLTFIVVLSSRRSAPRSSMAGILCGTCRVSCDALTCVCSNLFKVLGAVFLVSTNVLLLLVSVFLRQPFLSLHLTMHPAQLLQLVVPMIQMLPLYILLEIHMPSIQSCIVPAPRMTRLSMLSAA